MYTTVLKHCEISNRQVRSTRTSRGMSQCTHRPSTHTYKHYTYLANQLKDTKQRFVSEEDRGAEVKTWHRYCFGQQKEDMSRVEVRPEGFQRGCLSERKVEVIAWPKTEKALQPTVESVIRGRFRCLYEIHVNAERER